MQKPGSAGIQFFGLQKRFYNAVKGPPLALSCCGARKTPRAHSRRSLRFSTAATPRAPCFRHRRWSRSSPHFQKTPKQVLGVFERIFIFGSERDFIFSCYKAVFSNQRNGTRLAGGPRQPAERGHKKKGKRAKCAFPFLVLRFHRSRRGRVNSAFCR